LTVVGSQRVPSEGNKKAKLVAVGEAPGREEEGQGRPFVGKSGQLLERYLERLNVDRRDIFLSNLLKYRPRNNKFEVALKTQELKDGLVELALELQEIQPNVILALGAWPLYYLTGMCGSDNQKKPKPGTGIKNYRGSILPCTLVPGLKVIACYHPAYVLRNWSINPIFFNDIRRAVEDSEFPELNLPIHLRPRPFVP